MTKERKIEILKDLLVQLSDSANILCTCEADERCEVVEECIKALEQQPCEDKVTITFNKGTLKHSDKGYVVYNKDWFRKHFATEVAIMTGYDGYIEQPTSDDSVSRAEITYELNRLGRNAFKDDTDYDNFFAFVDSLPPVTPTHKVGKWIYHFERDDYNDYENEYYECPFCHDLGGDKYYHYCPVCGNKVKGVEDGSN